MAKPKRLVHAFEYTSCVYESGPSVVSLHRTEKGANKALAKWLKNHPDFDNRYQAVGVTSYEIEK